MHGYFYAKSLQLCPSLCAPMHCSLPGFSVHEILQARILEWILECRALLQAIFPNQGSNLHLLCLWHYTASLSKFEWREFGWEGRLPFCELGECWGRGEIMDENIIYLGICSLKRMCIFFVRWSGLSVLNRYCWLMLCLNSSISLLNLCIVILPIYER